MAISYSCDGCGKAVENPEKVGHVVKREYCAPCAGIAREFIEQEEALRKATHERFIDERAALISVFKDFKLPDVPT